MMKGFEPVTLSWGDETYTVPAEGQLLLIGAIEDALSGKSGQQAVAVLMNPGGPPYTRLAAAYGAALRYAGATVSDDEIYLSIMGDFANQSKDVAVKIQSAILALLAIIAPPIALSLSAQEVSKKKRPTAKKPQKGRKRA